MPVFSVRVPDELAGRFDSAAGPGGRSALLRRLIAGAGTGQAPAGRLARRDALRLMVRLAAPEAAHVLAEAAAMGLSRSGWVAALVRRHTLARPTFDRGAELRLLAIQGEIRRIGVNVNQIARALNTAVMEGRVLDTELTAIDDLRRELRAHIGALHEAFAGNLAYWLVEP